MGGGDLAAVGVVHDQAGGAATAAGRFAQIRVVQNILERCHKLDQSEFLKVNRLLQARIEQYVARTLNDAAAGVAETAVRRRRENRRVESLIDGVR